ncbi:MAG: ABC transporter permease [Actinobacteria bacterium]|nr:ABC transporter permease [Actinomycetota bacterium]
MTSAVEQWRIALSALRGNWFRATLTALGIVIGVASLVAVSAVSAGAQASVAESLRLLGANVVIVDGEIISTGTTQTATDRTITPDDVASIRALASVTAVAPHQDIETSPISAGRFSSTTWLVGSTPEYATIHNRTVSLGRRMSAADVTFGRSVIEIGTVVRARLFPTQNPIGQRVRIGNLEFEVIGVLDRRGKLGQDNLDNRVLAPLPIVTRVMLGGVNTRSVDVRVRSEADVVPVQDEIATLLRRAHRLPASLADDFTTEDQASILKTAQSATTSFRLLTFALGGIALLVGGIGIMNMMLVSVHERTREIGIRKSVGADPRRVQSQFLIEAAVLSTLGGLAGVVAGVGATALVGALVGWPTLVSPLQVLWAFSASVAVGLFFGYAPARRAARLDPIVALRYE